MERDEIDEGIAPSHAGGDAVRFGRVLPDDGQALTGSDVVSGNPVVVRFNVKLFGQKFFPAGQAVAATHGHEYSGGGIWDESVAVSPAPSSFELDGQECWVGSKCIRIHFSLNPT
jgi:hypothetical protein